MKDFSEIPRTTGAFPNVQAYDSSGPTARDGTPVVADMTNEVWGFFQALLSRGLLSPNDASETAGEYAPGTPTPGAPLSQLVQSVTNISGGPGELVWWGGPRADLSSGFSPEVTRKRRLLPLQGQVVLIADYRELCEAVMTANEYGFAGSEHLKVQGFYRCDNMGGRSPTGNYMRLPDCQGLFLRAHSTNRRYDPSVRDVAMYQPAQMAFHKHHMRLNDGLVTFSGKDYATQYDHRVIQASDPLTNTHRGLLKTTRDNLNASRPPGEPLTRQSGYSTPDTGDLIAASHFVASSAEKEADGLEKATHTVPSVASSTVQTSVVGPERVVAGGTPAFQRDTRPHNMNFHLMVRY
jgi:hypothetical protein